MSLSSEIKAAAARRLPAARTGIRRGHRLRRPRQRRGQRQRGRAVRLPAGVGHRGRQRDGRPRPVPLGQTRAGHRTLTARIRRRPHPNLDPGSRTGSRPNWSPWQPISPKWSVARSRCTCCSTCRCWSVASSPASVSLLLLAVQNRRGQRVVRARHHRPVAGHRDRFPDQSVRRAAVGRRRSSAA